MRYWILIVVALAFGHITPLQASSKNALDQLALLGDQLIKSYNMTEQPDRPLAERIANFIATGVDTGEIISEEKGKIKYAGGKKYGLRKTPANLNEKTQLMLQIGRLAYLSYSDVSGVLDASINGILAQAIKGHQKHPAKKHAFLVFLAYDFMKAALGGVFLPIAKEAFEIRLTEKIRKDSKDLKSGFGKLKNKERARYIKYFNGMDIALKEVVTLAINGGNVPKELRVSGKDLASPPPDVPEASPLASAPPPPPMDPLELEAMAKKQARRVIRNYQAASGLRIWVEDVLRQKIARLREKKKAKAMAAKKSSEPVSLLSGLQNQKGKLKKASPPPAKTEGKGEPVGGASGLQSALAKSLANYRQFVQQEEDNEDTDPIDWD